MSVLIKSNNDGFTVVELIISIAIGFILLGVALGIFNVQYKSYSLQEQITNVQQNVRAAMDIIVKEVRMAGYDPTGANINGIIYDTDQLQILADLDGNGTTTAGSNEDITYRYYNTSNYPLQIKRRTGNGNFQPLAENIQAFTFEYLDENGTSTTESDDIRQVRISITGRTEKKDSSYPENDGYRTFNLTTVITPRNLWNEDKGDDGNDNEDDDD